MLKYLAVTLLSNLVLNSARNDIIAQLQKQLLPLGGFKTLRTDNPVSIGLPAIEQSFPNAAFPIGCVHEFICPAAEEISAAHGFIAGLASRFLQLGAVCLWISHNRQLFPAALKLFNINPEQVLFIDLKRERDILYVVEDALKCNKLCIVIGELQQISFKESRRFQLAAEQSRVTCFLLRNQPRITNTITAVSRWQVRSLPSELQDGLPGVGFPRWEVELVRVRNGVPGKWTIEWKVDAFVEVPEVVTEQEYTHIRKVG